MAICENYIVYQGDGPDEGPFPIQTINNQPIARGDLVQRDSERVYEVIEARWVPHGGLHIRTHYATLRAV